MKHTGRWPFKKSFTVILVMASLVYFTLWGFIIYRTVQKNLPAARELSGREAYPGRSESWFMRYR